MRGEPLTHLDGQQIEVIIPHRKPFRFIDEVTYLQPGKRAEGKLSDLSAPEYAWLRSHFPGYPVVPGFIIAEALAELGAIAVFSLPEFQGKVGFLAGANNLKFRFRVQPGDNVHLAMWIKSLSGTRFGTGQGDAHTIPEGRSVCSGEISFAALDKPAEMQS